MTTRIVLDVENTRGNGSISENRRVIRLLDRPADRHHCFLFAGWLWEIEHNIRFWIDENCRSRVTPVAEPVEAFIPAFSPNEFYLDFEDATEALLFKLTWGGK